VLIAAAQALNLYRLRARTRPLRPHPGARHARHQRHRPDGAVRHPQRQHRLLRSRLLLALLGFVGTVALCKFLLRGDIIE
jgi:hypothetical protein